MSSQCHASKQQLLDAAKALNERPDQTLAELLFAGKKALRINRLAGWAILSAPLLAVIAFMALKLTSRPDLNLLVFVLLLVPPATASSMLALFHFTRGREVLQAHEALARPLSQTDDCTEMAAMLDRAEAAGVTAVIAKDRELYGVDYFLAHAFMKDLDEAAARARAHEQRASNNVARRDACAALHARL